MVYVIGVPGVMCLLVLSLFRMDLWRHFAMAWDRMKERAYFVLFLVYPAVCRRSFSIFNCRRLGEQLSVLIDDYDLLCMVCQTWRDTAASACAPCPVPHRAPHAACLPQ